MPSDLTNPFAEHGLPVPAVPIDIDAVGADFLAKAQAETRLNYWTERTPKQFREFDINNPGLRHNLSQIHKVLRWQFGSRGLLLSGPTNLGKSRCLYALTRRLLCVEHHEVTMMTAHEFVSGLNEHTQFGQDGAEGYVRGLSLKKILFMDDYGQESVLKTREDWVHQWFFRLLDLRRGEGLPLLITTNLTVAGIAARHSNVDPFLTRLVDVAEPVTFLAGPNISNG